MRIICHVLERETRYEKGEKQVLLHVRNFIMLSANLFSYWAVFPGTFQTSFLIECLMQNRANFLTNQWKICEF